MHVSSRQLMTAKPEPRTMEMEMKWLKMMKKFKNKVISLIIWMIFPLNSFAPSSIGTISSQDIEKSGKNVSSRRPFVSAWGCLEGFIECG